MDEHTFKVLAESPYFKLVATNRLQDFEGFKSRNPADGLFRKVYKLIQHKSKKLSLMFMHILSCVLFIGSRLTKKYFNYLNLLQANDIDILDFSNIQETRDYIKSNKIDLLVVNNWWLLPDDIIHAPRFGTLNIHPSILPAYRGSVPVLWSLKHNDKNTAVTFMLLNAEVDGGDIIKQHMVSIDDKDDSITLEDNCNKVIAEFLAIDIKNYIEGKIKPFRQDINKASKTAKYYDYQKIDWKNELSRDIVNKIKLYPYAWPLDKCYTYFNSRRIDFHDAEICQQIPDNISNTSSPGTAVIKGIYLYVKARDGVVRFNLLVDLTMTDILRFLSLANKRIQFD